MNVLPIDNAGFLLLRIQNEQAWRRDRFEIYRGGNTYQICKIIFKVNFLSISYLPGF